MGLGNDHENQSNTQLREKIFVYLERFYCSIIEKTQSSGNILVQFWVADIVTRAKGRQYCELRTQSQLFYHDQSDDRRLLSYRNHVVARSFRVSAGQEEDEGDDENWQELLGITGSVFKNKKAEVSPRISHYSTDEYPERDFALSCGIQASLCLPLFATDDFSGHPNGVIELVFTSEEDFHHLKPYIYYYYSVHSTLRMPEVKSILRSNISCISPGRGVSWLTPSAWKLQWDTDTNFLLSVPCLSPLGSPKRLDQNVQVIETSGSSNSFSEDVSKTEIPTRMKINRNVLTEESPGEESQPLTFQSKKTIPRQEGKEGTQLLDPLAQQLVLDDALQSQKKGLALGMENFNTDIHIVNKTRIEVTSDRENNSEESISFENLRKHFGRPLDDAAKSFGVSRSTFKRVCRDHGIKRWKSGKRRMGKNISSKLEGELNDEESSKRNFSHSGMAPVEDRTVVAHKIQDTNKMTVKATYNGVTIKFELSNLSGITELQDKVIERLQVERKCFSIKYQDDEGDWILIACDKDVQECIEISRSLKKTTIRMVIDPPIIHYAP
ncbi:protein NLP1 isoform X3 [Daucus carota subsp. sativus]|uniref:protein NLP1 isoform X3 n=1 Tax=Daucus carota subsp. sativus TaxID=79200 RepID=UPI003082E7BF